jgi:hypothetical protein
MIKATEQLPAPRRENRAADASERYLNWQAGVVSFRQGHVAEELPGLLWKKELTPQLKSDISHFSVTQDGTYFLAQDDFAITVLQRDPLKIVLQIPAIDARPDLLLDVEQRGRQGAIEGRSSVGGKSASVGRHERRLPG